MCTLQENMFYEAYNFQQDLSTWLEWVNKVPNNDWCGGGASCFLPSNEPSNEPSIPPTSKLTAPPTNYPTFATKDGIRQFTSSLALRDEVSIYCKDPVNYDSTEYG